MKNEISIDEKKLLKRLYDIEYRKKNIEKIKAAKIEYFKRTYDPVKWSKIRRTDAYRKKHKKYLNTPEYKEWKKEYDQEYRSTKIYGPEWSEVHRILLGLETQIKENTTKYDIRLQNQTLNKAQRRIRNGTTKRSYS